MSICVNPMWFKRMSACVNPMWFSSRRKFRPIRRLFLFRLYIHPLFSNTSYTQSNSRVYYLSFLRLQHLNLFKLVFSFFYFFFFELMPTNIYMLLFSITVQFLLIWCPYAQYHMLIVNILYVSQIIKA